MQGLNNHRTKSEIVRSTRMMAQKHRGRTKVYKRFHKWQETDVGTIAEKYHIELKWGWSFEKDTHTPLMTFDSLALAMRGMHKTYLCQCEECLDTVWALKSGFNCVK